MVALRQIPPEPPDPAAGEVARTLDRLREVAADLFARRGYGGTSMSEIAAGVGVRKASLYNYYRSKEELLLDLLDRSFAAWREASRPALEAEGSVEDRLRAHIEAAVDFALEHPEKVAILRVAGTQIGGELGREVGELLADTKARYLERLEAFFAEAVARGEVEAEEPRNLALACRAFLDGLLTNLIFRPDADRVWDDRMPELWRILWRGLSGRPASEEAR